MGSMQRDPSVVSVVAVSQQMVDIVKSCGARSTQHVEHTLLSHQDGGGSQLLPSAALPEETSHLHLSNAQSDSKEVDLAEAKSIESRQAKLHRLCKALRSLCGGDIVPDWLRTRWFPSMPSGCSIALALEACEKSTVEDLSSLFERSRVPVRAIVVVKADDMQQPLRGSAFPAYSESWQWGNGAKACFDQLRNANTPETISEAIQHAMTDIV